MLLRRYHPNYNKTTEPTEPGTEPTEAPAKTAKVAEWRTYAVEAGALTAEQAEGMKKADIIAATEA